MPKSGLMKTVPERMRPGLLAVMAAGILQLFARTGTVAVENSSANIEFFEKKIRPVLHDHCFECHGSKIEKPKGRLLADSREGLSRGGDSGPAIVAGDPDKSLLIKAVRYTDPDLQMPPKNKKLSESQIADLTAWVKMGAPWPPQSPAPRGAVARRGEFEITAKDRAYWAFQPVRKPAAPRVKRARWAANPIDSWVLAALEAKDLPPSPAATRRELISRATYDLTGLPPSPERIEAFERDASPGAYEKVIDELLGSPQYGERWARHWLDVVRFAQSNGYERDGEKPMAWRYRDYVIKSFNEDKPYDRFILEQLAGDELPDATADSIVATGLQRLGVWDDEPDDKMMADFDELDDILSTSSAAFLGLTMGCARCHDHKFDPIPQADYYRLLSFFRNVRPYENVRFAFDSANYVPLAPAEKVAQWKLAQQQKIKALEARAASATQDGEKKKLREEIKSAKDAPGPFEWALAVRERSGKPPATHVFTRGNPRSPGLEVEPGFLTVLGGEKPVLPPCTEETASSGRRTVLAKWIASPKNPLTARVMVNRLWQHHFGRGIVKTTTDFGRAGVPPTNPALLDWLAAEFCQSGWSVKKMHRLIMLSSSYQMSARIENLRASAIDPANDLLWRQNLRRLEAESIRDSILSVSGQINLEMGGRGFFPHLGGEVLAGASRPGLDWQKSSPQERSRRSVYAYIRRTMLVPELEMFDYSNTASPLGERPSTTVAPQALLLLNDEFMQQQAAAFAQRLLAEARGDIGNLIRRGYLLALRRNPTPNEMQLASAFFERQRTTFGATSWPLLFRPQVPSSLSVEYMKQLNPSDFLNGPGEGWSYHRGRWSGTYEGIRTVDRDRTPFALWRGNAFSNGVIRAAVEIDRSAEFASVLFRATVDGDELRGCELLFDPRRGSVSLRRHDAQLVTLAETNAVIPASRVITLEIKLNGPRIRVSMGRQSEPLVDFTDSAWLPAQGSVGVRAWGAPLQVHSLSLSEDGRAFHQAGFPPAGEGWRETVAKKKALEAFCLLLFNLNEFVYVD